MPKKTAWFRFHGRLNDCLPQPQRGRDIRCEFQGAQSVKHLFESCGVPHTEVARILANAVPVTQKYLVEDGDRIELFPPPDGPEAAPATPPRFVLDNHLGKLAAYLRLLGFDASYRNDLQDQELAAISSQEGRVLLTRDRRLLMRSVVTQGYWVRSLLPRQQVLEVLQRFGLAAAITPFGRCVHCNSQLEAVSKQAVLDQLEPLTRLYFDEFQRCPGCGQVYWKGSHYQHIQEFIRDILQRQGAVAPEKDQLTH